MILDTFIIYGIEINHIYMTSLILAANNGRLNVVKTLLASDRIDINHNDILI